MITTTYCSSLLFIVFVVYIAIIIFMYYSGKKNGEEMFEAMDTLLESYDERIRVYEEIIEKQKEKNNETINS